jgi:hypothetical protein
MFSIKGSYKYLFEGEEIQEKKNKRKMTKVNKNKLSNLFKKSYPEFMPALSELTFNEKFMNSLEGDGQGEDKLIIETKQIKCRDLIPLQNEIGASESLDYPLHNKISEDRILKICSNEVCDESVYDSKGRSIITSGGKYIVDGHHRWSSVFVLNPDCIIEVKDIGTYKKGVDALKLSQIIIASLSKIKGKIPSKKAKGVNIINAPKEEIMNYISNQITDDFIKTYIQCINLNKVGNKSLLSKRFQNKAGVIKYITKNCMLLQSNGIDSEAQYNERYLMPQFDDQGSYLSRASNGEVNLSDIRIAMDENKKLLNKWKKLAGLL